MSDQRLRKLEDIKTRLEQVIVELDAVLNETRESDGDGKCFSADDFHWILQLSQQREVLATVAALITDPTFDSAIADGEVRRDGIGR